MGRCFTAIYCDDIRQEINGKYTLVGCYGSHMFLSEFPAKLPRFNAHTTLYIPLSESFSHIRIVLNKGAEEIAESAFDVEPDMLQDVINNDNNLRFHAIIGAFSLTNFEIDEPTLIDVTAYVDGVPLMGPRLIVERMRSLGDEPTLN